MGSGYGQPCVRARVFGRSVASSREAAAAAEAVGREGTRLDAQH